MKSRLTETLNAVTKRIKWPNYKSIGYEGPERRDRYINPLLTPPPRSPRSVEDFKNPGKLGHWYPLGFDYSNPVRDKYKYHEFVGISLFTCTFLFWSWIFGPDYIGYDWSRREAFLRTAKREALGLPLVDRDVVPVERVVLPTEEELKMLPFPVTY